MIWLGKNSVVELTLSLAQSVASFGSLEMVLWKTNRDDNTTVQATLKDNNCVNNTVTITMDTTGLSGEYHFELNNGEDVISYGILTINTTNEYVKLDNGVVISS